MTQNKILYKSLPADKAPHGHKYLKGKWYKIEGKLKICKNGYHASENIIDAMGYVDCAWIARVEVRGESVIHDDKQCWSEMRIVEWHKWSKKDSVALAVFASELVIDIFEKKYPDDKRPREAIEAAKNYLQRCSIKNRSEVARAASAAARAARAARAASAASEAASEAAWAASAAAWAASAASEAASEAAWAASEASEVASEAEILELCHNFVVDRKFEGKAEGDEG